ncbi:hypothetical protein HanIR_Chr03g0112081 [Helianthus annuus]|nr:hypothetical protein HanIR_Chr03g0112081 [Helianthus annuus]
MRLEYCGGRFSLYNIFMFGRHHLPTGKSSIQATWRIGASACSCYVIPNASASLSKCFWSKICCNGF